MTPPTAHGLPRPQRSTKIDEANMKKIPIVAFCFIAQMVLTDSSGWAADARHGEQLAHRWCADCHVVAPNQHRPTTEAAPFATVARRPGFTAEQLAFFLLSPHPKMPDMSLTRTEASDLAAYIKSLAR